MNIIAKTKYDMGFIETLNRTNYPKYPVSYEIIDDSIIIEIKTFIKDGIPSFLHDRDIEILLKCSEWSCEMMANACVCCDITGNRLKPYRLRLDNYFSSTNYIKTDAFFLTKEYAEIVLDKYDHMDVTTYRIKNYPITREIMKKRVWSDNYNNMQSTNNYYDAAKAVFRKLNDPSCEYRAMYIRNK